MVRCRECGRRISGEWFWYRTRVDWRTGEAEVQTFCRECASCMVDERTTNGLIVTYAPPETEARAE